MATLIPAPQFLSELTRLSHVTTNLVSMATVLNQIWLCQLLDKTQPDHTCAELRDTVFMEKSGCDDTNPQYGICDVIEDRQSAGGKRECTMRCKCAESADQCMIDIFSGITLKDVSICEIKADRRFD